jgi:hypothetical protein
VGGKSRDLSNNRKLVQPLEQPIRIPPTMLEAYRKVPTLSYLDEHGRINLKVGSLHPVACTRSGSGFPSNATLF